LRRYGLKRINLPLWLLACLTIILVATSVIAADYQVTKRAGALTVDVAIDRNPPIVGKNNVDIAIKDSAGKSVTDAKVLVEYSMPGMPGMPPMNYKTSAAIKETHYKAVMDLSMPGSWNVSIRIVRAQKTQSAKFTIDAK
jgi:hypothetical protein